MSIQFIFSRHSIAPTVTFTPDTLLVISTPEAPTQTPTTKPTDTLTPTNTPTVTATHTPTSSPTVTNTATDVPTDTPTVTATNTPIPTPTDTPTTIPPTETPTPDKRGGVYPPIPEGQGLLYVINYFGSEAQFRFYDQTDYYLIPGKDIVPEGANMEFFLNAGHYRWVSLVPAANIGNEGEFDIAAGQVHGLGLLQAEGSLQGLWLGPDPLAPPITPTPTPIPTPPTPSPGKTVLIFDPAVRTGDLLFPDRKYVILPETRLFLELEPGFYDINQFCFFR